jgi:hypothetical protein
MNALDNGGGAFDRGAGRDPPDQAPLARLAGEQAALRRVATLVARATPPQEVFAAVAGWRLWGVLGVGTTTERPLPPDAEARLASFAELVATAIANAESRAALTQLVEEQAALRRVATLAARGVPPVEIFSAVSDEVARLFRARAVVLRFSHDGPAVVCVGVSKSLQLPVGTRRSSSREWLRRRSTAPDAPPASTRWSGRRPAGPPRQPPVAWVSSRQSGARSLSRAVCGVR